MEFRNAVPDDAPALAALHVASWRETYHGLLPEAMLAGQSVTARADMWRMILQGPVAAGVANVFMALDKSSIVGFGACGPQRDPALQQLGFGGEIGALYILRSHQHRGAGRTIVSMAAAALASRAQTGMALWVLGGNVAARDFYERLGGSVVSTKDAPLPEIAYGWRDLSCLQP